MISSIKDKLLPLGDDVTFIPVTDHYPHLVMSACIIPSCKTNARLVKAHKKARFLSGLHCFNAYSTATIASHSGAILSGVSRPRLRDQKQQHIRQTLRAEQHLFFCQATEGEHAVLFDDKLKSRFAPFSCSVLTNN